MADAYEAKKAHFKKLLDGLIKRIDTPKELADLIRWDVRRVEHAYENGLTESLVAALKASYTYYANKIGFSLEDLTKAMNIVVSQSGNGLNLSSFVLADENAVLEVEPFGKITKENLEDRHVAVLVFQDPEKYKKEFKLRKEIVLGEAVHEELDAKEEPVKEEPAKEEKTKTIKVTEAWLKANPAYAKQFKVGDEVELDSEGNVVQ